MTDAPLFVLDANVFIQAKRLYYAFDLAPKFWDSLVLHASSGKVVSIDRVKHELDKGKDDLTEWSNGHFHSAFASTDEEDIIKSYSEIIAWVQGQPQFSDAAKTEFATVADGWLIAYAKVKGKVIVTQELPAPDAKSRVPIPNVCEAFDVPFVDTFEMLRRLGVRFG